MKIGDNGIKKIAEMICGDSPFDFFPYRSSSYLTRFFHFMDMDYVHDGTTRRFWVNDVLMEINNKKELSPNMPSKEMVKTIENLIHPDHFLFNPKVDLEKAKKALKACLNTYNLTIAEQPNGHSRVCPLWGEFISTDHSKQPYENIITFKPSVFNIPNKRMNNDLISVMMPFKAEFFPTYEAVKRVVEYMKKECLRADNIWENSTFMQDVFDLIFCSNIVIVDFTGRNPNVMYETGIAHTLGKTVIPLTQSFNDIPSDLGHHRALKYLPNEEGYQDLSKRLHERLKVIYKIET